MKLHKPVTVTAGSMVVLDRAAAIVRVAMGNKLLTGMEPVKGAITPIEMRHQLGMAEATGNAAALCGITRKMQRMLERLELNGRETGRL